MMTITNIKSQDVFPKKASGKDAQPGEEWQPCPQAKLALLLCHPGLPKLFPGLRCPFPSSSSNFCSSRSSLGAPSSPIQLVEGTCLITETLVSLSSLCLSIGPLGTSFIHRFSPAGLHMLTYTACRLHGWWVYQLGHRLAASIKVVALKCRKLLPGDMWPRPGIHQTATAEEVVLLAPVGGGQSDAKHPAVHMAAPNTGSPSM